MKTALITLLASLTAAGVVQAAPVQPATVRTSLVDQAELVLVPAGPFVYGEEARKVRQLVTEKLKAGWLAQYGSEAQRQSRQLGAFYLDRYEVTNARYALFLRANPQARPSRFASYPQFNAPQQPVVGIGWAEASAYCAWAGRRLPTEEEWEKAARGSDGRIWPWGNEPNPDCYNGRAAGHLGPAPVGTHRDSDSPLGISDLAGNVWEMTATRFDEQRHVMRGGSYLNRLPDVRTTVRWPIEDEPNGSKWLGFRCAVSAERIDSGR